MQRRDFLKTLAGGAMVALSPQLAFYAPRVFAAPSAATGAYDKLLILVELKGGNDGLNTVVPYADAEYYRLRPRIAIKREEVLQLDERTGLNPALQPLLALWQSRELAVIQGLGYPDANLSHFRSIEIWDTASKSEEYLHEGWLARAFALSPAPASFAADGVIVGSAELGPLAGSGVRAIALSNPEQFLRQAKLAAPGTSARNEALQHIMKVESDVAQAALKLGNAQYAFRTEFPKNEFGNTVKTACQVIAAGGGVAAVRLTLSGFDTHQNQPGVQANLHKQLAEGLLALKAALLELNRWDKSLIVTYAEFGRRPKENQSNGTDHGTANAHFVIGGAVRGGLYGAAPPLTRLDGNGNLPFAVDFRSLYATILERHWGLPSAGVLGGRFEMLPILKM